MLAGFLLGIVHDRRLMREAQVNVAIRWFVGYGLHEMLPDHSSLTRIRQRWGAERFRWIFQRSVKACVEAKIAKGEVVHVDASLIRANVSWESLAVRHADAVAEANEDDADVAERTSRQTAGTRKSAQPIRKPRWRRTVGTDGSNRPTNSMRSSTMCAASFSTSRSRPEKSMRGRSSSNGLTLQRRRRARRSQR